MDRSNLQIESLLFYLRVRLYPGPDRKYAEDRKEVKAEVAAEGI